MRLSVRVALQINMFLGFSSTGGCTPHSLHFKKLYLSTFPFSRQDVFRDCYCSKEKKTLFWASTKTFRVTDCHRTHAADNWWMLAFLPFANSGTPHCQFFFFVAQNRLTHVQILFTWNPSQLQSSIVTFEYLLLQPRSALYNVAPTLSYPA